MSTVAQRVGVVEDRLDRIERLVEQLVEDTARFREQIAKLERDRERDREQDRQQRERERQEWERQERERQEREHQERERERQQREQDRKEWEQDRQQRERERQEWERQEQERQEQERQERERQYQQWERDRRAMNKQWSELAAKMGTVVEDIVAPSVRRMARELFDCGEELLFTSRIDRVRSDDRSRRREFDVLYVGDRAVLLNETKSSPRNADARRFVRLVRSGEFFLYFPEYKDLPLVPVFSSLSLPADLVTYLTRNGIYALAMGDEAMQVLNLDAVRGKVEKKAPGARGT